MAAKSGLLLSVAATKQDLPHCGAYDLIPNRVQTKLPFVVLNSTPDLCMKTWPSGRKRWDDTCVEHVDQCGGARMVPVYHAKLSFKRVMRVTAKLPPDLSSRVVHNVSTTSIR